MIVIYYHFIVILNNNHLSLHQQTMIFASKVSKTKSKKQISSKLQVLYEINRDDDATVVH